MIGLIEAVIIASGPTLVVAGLGVRASLARKDSAWADYADVAMLLGWFTVPVIVVAVPFLAREMGLGSFQAGLTGAAALLLLGSASGVFAPERLSPPIRLRRILASCSGQTGIAVYLAFSGLVGDALSLAPSATLFITLLWATYVGRSATGHLLRRDYRRRPLGPGELFNRMGEIARRRGAELENIILITRMPGCLRHANALAMHGTQVAVTEDLIRGLNREEVDAVLEHEIGHIADERLWTIDNALRYGCYLLVIALAFAAERYVTAAQLWPGLLYAIWVSLFVVPELLSRWYCRKMERRANRNVGFVTEPISAITAYCKLAMLNHHPISRPWWSRVISTHPCADEAISAFAVRANLTAAEVAQACERAEAEVQSGCVRGYELAATGGAARAGKETVTAEPAERPGGLAVCGVAILALVGGAAFLCGSAIALGPAMTDKYPMWVTFALGFLIFFGTGLVIVLPIEVVSRRRQRRIRKQVADNLTARYGDDMARRSLLIDVVLPDWVDRNRPWQGALVRVSDGKMDILAEADSLSIPLDTKIHVSRYANPNSSGSGAMMVMIAYHEEGALRTVLTRVLGRPERGTPRGWKQLERSLKSMLADSGVATVSRKDLISGRKRQFRWSARTPIATVLYLAILMTADFIARAMYGDGDWYGRGCWCFLATCFAGSGLWAWVTRARKTDGE